MGDKIKFNPESSSGQNSKVKNKEVVLLKKGSITISDRLKERR